MSVETCPKCGTKIQRSRKSHGHYFACIKAAWDNLESEQQRLFGDPDSLRKFALIKEGFCTTQSYIADSPDEAARVAVFLRHRPGYSITTVTGNLVTHTVAESQDSKSMGKKRFQESKAKVLERLAHIIGVSADELSDNARAAR